MTGRSTSFVTPPKKGSRPPTHRTIAPNVPDTASHEGDLSAATSSSRRGVVPSAVTLTWVDHKRIQPSSHESWDAKQPPLRGCSTVHPKLSLQGTTNNAEAPEAGGVDGCWCCCGGEELPPGDSSHNNKHQQPSTPPANGASALLVVPLGCSPSTSNF